jgi:hypothetical protein
MRASPKQAFLVAYLLAFGDAGCVESASVRSNATQDVAAATIVALPTSGYGSPGVTRGDPMGIWPVGSVSWCCSTWWTPLPVSPGDAISSMSVRIQDNAQVAGDPGNQVVAELRSQIGGAAWTTVAMVVTSGSGLVQDVTLTLQTPHTLALGEVLSLTTTEQTGYPFPAPTHASSVGPISFTVVPAPI